MLIDTREDLQAYLKLAIQIELSTIPPYLFAMYSIADQQSDAALLIRSIVAEEMLHAALAANLLLAVGGRPAFDAKEPIPTYPSLLPHHQPSLELRLEPCSLELVRDVLLRIEQPEVHSVAADADVFESLGQFYHALENGITDLSGRLDLFVDPQADSQLTDPSFYSPVAYDAEDSGGLMLIDGPESAVAAIEVIVHQGEGLSTARWADPAHQELTHYFKLLEIADGTVPLGRVLPLVANPRSADYPADLQPVSELYNACYRYLFLVLHELFSPAIDKTNAVRRLYRLMGPVLSVLAQFLVGRLLPNGRHAAPTFEIFEFASADPRREIRQLAKKAAGLHPQLADVEAVVFDL